MGSLHQRMMDSEAEANKEIQRKDYHHTSAYAQLTGADLNARASSDISGKAINHQLMTRAREYIKTQARVNDYQSSHLGAHSFRTTRFNEEDEITRKQMLAKGSATREKKKRDYLKERQVNARRGMQADLDSSYKDHSSGGLHSIKNDSSSPSIGKTNEPQKHHFTNPTSRGYNPYG